MFYKTGYKNVILEPVHHSIPPVNNERGTVT